MRIRTVKPDFFLDERLAVLSCAHRLLFQGLWLIADREGRLEDRPRRIQATIFPYDHKLDVPAMLSELVEGGFIRRYEVDGETFIDIPGFLKHQRPNAREPQSVIPPWTTDASDAHARTCTHSTNADGGMHAPIAARARTAGREGNGKGNRREGNGNARAVPALASPAFDHFWELYPRKEGKQEARKVWFEELKPDQSTEIAISNALSWQRRQPRWLEEAGKYIPHPATYLRKRRWEDEPPMLPNVSTKTAGNLANIAEWVHGNH